MDSPATLKLLCDAYDVSGRAENSDELRVEMSKFATHMGFEHFAYALTVCAPTLKERQFVISGFPQRWHERYVQRNYFRIDPVLRHMHTSSLPAIWSDRLFHGCESVEFWEEAKASGLEGGVSFAVHEQPGVTGIFSLARDLPLDLRQAEMSALVGRAQIFASMMHQAVVRLHLPKLLPEKAIALTPRERECLKWSADGKTAWEIGRILNIAERTVVFHVNNVVQKLGASNKTQAIVRALTLKLV